MRAKVRMTGAMLTGVLVLPACAGSGDTAAETDHADHQAPSAAPSPEGDRTPTLGGRTGTPAKHPAKEMDELEKPIANQLAKQISGSHLSMDYLDCPNWNGKAPQKITCTGYFSGVTGDVSVRLTRTATSVDFDAELQDGVLATANLVHQLKAAGYTEIDCGDKPAYPTVVGSELICAVSRGEDEKHIVATVLDESGMVEIKDY